MQPAPRGCHIKSQLVWLRVCVWLIDLLSFNISGSSTTPAEQPDRLQPCIPVRLYK